MSVIDLGDEFAPDVEPSPRERHRSVRQDRVLRVVSLLVMLTVLLGASSLGPAAVLPIVARIPAAPGATLLIAGTRAIVVEIAHGANRISAYGLDDGVRHWTTRLTVLATDVEVVTRDDIVYVSFASPRVTGDHTDALDMRTGEMLWHSEGELSATLPDSGAVLLTTPMPTGPSRLELVDRATGVPRWSVSTGRTCVDTTSDDTARATAIGLVELCGADDTLSVRDLDTGRIRATRDIHLGTPFPVGPAAYRLNAFLLKVFGDIAVVGHSAHPVPVLEAYRADDLAPLWSGWPFAPEESLDRCGVNICVTEGAGTIMLDPRTGIALPLDAAVSVTASGPVDVAGRPTYVLLPARAEADATGTFATADFVTTAEDRTAVRIPDSAAGDTWVATRTGSAGPRLVVTPIKLLHGVRADPCLMLDGYLACARSDNRLTFWQLPDTS